MAITFAVQQRRTEKLSRLSEKKMLSPTAEFAELENWKGPRSHNSISKMGVAWGWRSGISLHKIKEHLKRIFFNNAPGTGKSNGL